jgi:aldehyde dehydrogenase (NAD+)
MITKTQLFIGGAWVGPATDDVIDVISPATEAIVAQVPAGSNADIDRAVAAARDAFDHGPWPRMSAQERAGYLTRVADILESRVDELAEILTLTNGTPTKSGMLVAYGPIAVLRAAAELLTTFEFVDTVQGLTAKSYLVYEPVGVVAAIAPWNGPLYLVAVKMGQALAAGCTVVVKPAPETPLDTYVLAEAIEAAGMPEGVVNIVAGGREVGQHLVEHPGIDKITFTGSTAAGRKIMAAAAKTMKRVTLELGGKSAGILLDDVDLDEALPHLVGGTTAFSGQVCALLSRVLVPRSRYDEIVDAYCAAISKLVVGDPADPTTDLGPLIAERQRERVEKYIALGQEEGAQVVLGGGRPSDLPVGWYIEPTVFVNVDNSMRIAREEIFGPVVVMIPYDTEEEAVAIANDTDYGLHGAVFTSNIERGIAIGRRVRTGTFTVNSWVLDPGIPFGGYKQSGIGRENGVAGLRAFLETKALGVPDGFKVEPVRAHTPPPIPRHRAAD